MRTGSYAPKYLLGDHLGSASVLVNADGSGAANARLQPLVHAKTLNLMG